MDATLPPISKTITLVGLMGAGKTSVGKRLAQHMKLPFTDADTEIEEAAGETVDEMFERHGEAFFRDGERRVIARLVDGPPRVLATGGGAFMDAGTRALLLAETVTIWLRADVDILLARVARRNNRPLLKSGDKRATLERLIAERYPVYAEAAITVESGDGPPEDMVERVLDALRQHEIARAPPEKPGPAQ